MITPIITIITAFIVIIQIIKQGNLCKVITMTKDYKSKSKKQRLQTMMIFLSKQGVSKAITKMFLWNPKQEAAIMMMFLLRPIKLIILMIFQSKLIIKQ